MIRPRSHRWEIQLLLLIIAATVSGQDSNPSAPPLQPVDFFNMLSTNGPAKSQFETKAEHAARLHSLTSSTFRVLVDSAFLNYSYDAETRSLSVSLPSDPPAEREIDPKTRTSSAPPHHLCFPLAYARTNLGQKLLFKKNGDTVEITKWLSFRDQVALPSVPPSVQPSDSLLLNCSMPAAEARAAVAGRSLSFLLGLRLAHDSTPTKTAAFLRRDEYDRDQEVRYIRRVAAALESLAIVNTNTLQILAAWPAAKR